MTDLATELGELGFELRALLANGLRLAVRRKLTAPADPIEDAAVLRAIAEALWMLAQLPAVLARLETHPTRH